MLDAAALHYEPITLVNVLAASTWLIIRVRRQRTHESFAMVNVEIYTSAMCAYCVAAKNLLKQKGLDYSEIRIDVDPARREEMLKRTQRRTVPQIFIAGQHIGGFDDLVAADRDGQLAQLIAGAA